ncbi:MAG: hypothetical protein AB1488_07785 [Nitrospirota bacterium]
MSADVKTIKIYMMPLEYPCGPQSACCGPIGQSEEEIKGLKETIERELRVNVGLIDVKKEGIRLSDSQVLKLLNTFGAMALPVIALDDKVVSMGNLSPQQAVQALRQKLAE